MVPMRAVGALAIAWMFAASICGRTGVRDAAVWGLVLLVEAASVAYSAR